LDNLGIVFQASEAYDWYAQKIGVTTEELDESEKKLAFQEFAISKVIEKSTALGDVVSETQMKQEKWRATVENLKTSLGKMLSPLSGLLPVLTNLMPMFGVMGAQLLPQMLTALKGLNLAFLTSPIGIAIMAIAAAIGFLYVAWKNNWGGIRDVFAAVANWIVSKFNWLSEKVQGVIDFFKGIFDWLGEAWRTLTGGGERTTGPRPNILVVGPEGMEEFQGGGVVQQTGPAILHRKEVVLTPEQAQALAGATINIEVLKGATIERMSDEIDLMDLAQKVSNALADELIALGLVA